MKIRNYSKKIKLYRQANPNLEIEKIGLLLTIENLYNHEPTKKEIKTFRDRYSHFDPNIIEKTQSGIRFLEIIESNKSEEKIKKKLNAYINIKFNHYDNFKTYDENMKNFAEKSKTVSSIINNILKRTKYPKETLNFFKETKEVSNTYDFYELVLLYKNAQSKRVKFEILRKIGLIIIISRVDRTFLPKSRNKILEEVKENIFHGLGLNSQKEEKIYFWINHENELTITKNLKELKDNHKMSVLVREKRAKKISPIQEKELNNCLTSRQNKISHIEFRNKLLKNEKPSYTSIIEKIIRKNLEYPNQVRDVYGTKIVVDELKDVEKIIDELESFLGGSSTRKEEKDTIHKFGKRALGKHSSKNYHVWKAIYDITLPHPNLKYVSEIMNEIPKDNKAYSLLKKQFKFLNELAKDYVVEIQIQDLKSYLLNICEQSETNHPILKMNQVRNNTFYKLFPRQIYSDELENLRIKILNDVE